MISIHNPPKWIDGRSGQRSREQLVERSGFPERSPRGKWAGQCQIAGHSFASHSITRYAGNVTVYSDFRHAIQTKIARQVEFAEVYQLFTNAVRLSWRRASVDADIDNFLATVYSTFENRDIDKSIDIIFDTIDRMLNSGDFSRCEEVLLSVDVDRLDSNLIVAFLVITLAAKDRIGEARSAFVMRATLSLERCHDLTEIREILDGLV